MPEPELVPVPFHTPAAGGEWWINQNNIRGDALRQEVIYEFGIMTGWIEADNSCKLPSLGIYFVRNDCRSRRPCPNRQTARPTGRFEYHILVVQIQQVCRKICDRCGRGKLLISYLDCTPPRLCWETQLQRSEYFGARSAWIIRGQQWLRVLRGYEVVECRFCDLMTQMRIGRKTIDTPIATSCQQLTII